MILDQLIDELETKIRDRVLSKWGHAIENVSIGIPPRMEMGDLACPVAMELARVLRRSPREIAEGILDGFKMPAIIANAKIEGAGYLNFSIDRGLFASAHFRSVMARPPGKGDRVLVEHTNINPNKAAHIGHIRNAVLGDTLVNCLRWLGNDVEIQNYIDDTGVQVADVVVGFERLLGESLSDVERRIDEGAELFDYFCWDLYARVAKHYEEHPDDKAFQSEALHRIEKGEGDTARIAAIVSDAIVERHTETMYRLGIIYDVLTEESDIIKLRFWDQAFEKLKDSGSVTMETEGKHAGCWVMKLADSPEFEGLEEPDKILVRSNGTVTYVGKDIAYQMWKFGLLGRTFGYREFLRYPDGHVLWQSTSDDDADAGAPRFGGAHSVYNVIDNRQAYLQKVVKEGLRLLGYEDQANRSIHFSYEMVALSKETAEELGLALRGDDVGKTRVEMSGRKGLGVKADDLMDQLQLEAEKAVGEGLKATDLDDEARSELATMIAIGALRYFMLKFGRNKVIAFDFKEALAFEGDSGPYLQYSIVRAENIFKKMKERGVSTGLDDTEIDQLTIGGGLDDDMWEIVRMSAETQSVIERSVDSLEFSTLTHHAFELCQRFNSFYHKYPILNEERTDERRRRAATAETFRQTMHGVCELLGIPVPERM